MDRSDSGTSVVLVVMVVVVRCDGDTDGGGGECGYDGRVELKRGRCW